MNFKLIRLLDKYLGIPICMLLKLTDIYYYRPKRSQEKILIIKFWGIGSMILTSPLIKAIRRRYPNCKIHFLTFSHNKGVYDDSTIIDNIIYYRMGNLFSFVPSLLKLIFFIRKEKFDVVIDAEQFSRASTIIAYLSGCHLRIGFNTTRQFRGYLYNKMVDFNDNIGIIDNYLNLGRPLQIVASSNTLAPIPYSSNDKEELERILSRHNICMDDILIGINVNASEFAKQRCWPKENFIQLSQRILSEYDDVKIIFTGLKEEEPYVSGIVNPLKSRRVINLTGIITLKQFAALTERLKIFISNDSGPVHLAVAMGCYTVTFFGPETPVLYAHKDCSQRVFYKELPCSPCISVYNAKNTTCRDNVCLKAITPDEVMEDIKKRLGAAS